MKRHHSAYFWIPRILCILSILFVSLFALDAFQPGLQAWEQIGAFLMHLIPSFVLLAILIIAWKWELIGGIIFIVIGLAVSPWIFTHNYAMNNSIWMSLSVILMIAVPFIVVGILFIADYRWMKKHSSN